MVSDAARDSHSGTVVDWATNPARSASSRRGSTVARAESAVPPENGWLKDLWSDFRGALRDDSAMDVMTLRQSSYNKYQDYFYPGTLPIDAKALNFVFLNPVLLYKGLSPLFTK